MTTLDALEPRAVWRHFAEFLRIPRPSGHEERILQYVRAAARRHGIEPETDAAGNVLLRVPARDCAASTAPVVLQGHVDKVDVKDRATRHDFGQDPVEVVFEDDWVTGRKPVTIGADNGIGCAMMLALLEARLVHPPLELLFTIDEEVGMTGAKRLAPTLLRGRRMINLDSEEDWIIYCGCAGGADTRLARAAQLQAAPTGAGGYRLSVSGLQGGHSGADIHRQRGNAIKLLAAVLARAHAQGIVFHLASMTGGDKHNAIPRYAQADLFLNAGDAARLRALARAAQAEARLCLAGRDDPAGIQLRPLLGAPRRALAPAQSARLVRLLAGLPHGVLGMSQALPELVETSNNLAVVDAGPDALVVWTSSRSSRPGDLAATLAQVRAVGALAGFRVEHGEGYPGWQANLDSPLLGLARKVYQRLYGSRCKVTAIHAGLECGVIGKAYPDMDMISIGPSITGAHSPRERVSIASVGRCWKALGRLLKETAAA